VHVSRVLFVVPPLTGHVNPTVSVAAELEARGHDVAWVGHPTVVRKLLPEGARLIELDDRIPQDLHRQMQERSVSSRGLVALKFLWEDFLVPLGRAMIPGVTAAVESFRPDVLAVDQQALAGGIVARKKGLPWVTMATTSAAVTDSLAGLPKVKAWVDGLLADMQRDNGLPVLEGHNCSEDAVIVFSTDALVGDVGRFPEQYHFVGPSFVHRGDKTTFPWEQLDDSVPRVLVSLGTVNAERGARFFRALLEGLREAKLQVILVAPPEIVGEIPDNAIVRPWVPQLALLKRVDAVVGHGGHNTVCETLRHGLPMVVAPIRDDQPVVAKQVVAAGAGVRVRFARVGAEGIRLAVEEVLADPSYRLAAERVQASFVDAGGPEEVAQIMEALM